MDSSHPEKIRGLHERARRLGRPAPRPMAGPRAAPPERPEPLAPTPRAISVAGLEFGCELPKFCAENPGKSGQEYCVNRAQTYEMLASLGFKTFRIPFRWERVQPLLGGPLDPDAIQHLRLQASLAAKVGGRAIFDLHNYGRFVQSLGDAPVEYALDKEVEGRVPVSSDDLAELWARLSFALCGLPENAGYGLMNEPHDLGEDVWVNASSKAVQAIRSGGDATPIYVSGDSWASAARWAWVNPSEPWIEDRENAIVYEAHCYFDEDASGQYRQSFDEELVQDPDLAKRPLARLEPFLTWLRDNDARGFLGELGVPIADEGWTSLLRPCLEALDQAGVQAAWWAAGEAWGDYPMALQPEHHGMGKSLAEKELFRAFKA